MESNAPTDDEPKKVPLEEVSGLLRAWSDGNRDALDRLTPIVYNELHRLARHYMKGERPGHSLQTTALVNEAYMRLVDYKAHAVAESRSLFCRFGPVDEAHSGGACTAPELKTRRRRAACLPGRERPWWAANGTADLVALDAAMEALARLDPRKVQVVEMRFFGGLSVEETAEVLKVSPVTVMRDWSTAKAWLYRELAGGTSDGL